MDIPALLAGLQMRGLRSSGDRAPWRRQLRHSAQPTPDQPLINGQRSAVGFWGRAARRSPRRPTGAAASRRRRRRFRPSGAPTALRASTWSVRRRLRVIPTSRAGRSSSPRVRTKCRRTTQQAREIGRLPPTRQGDLRSNGRLLTRDQWFRIQWSTLDERLRPIRVAALARISSLAQGRRAQRATCWTEILTIGPQDPRVRRSAPRRRHPRLPHPRPLSRPRARRPSARPSGSPGRRIRPSARTERPSRNRGRWTLPFRQRSGRGSAYGHASKA